MKPKKIIPRFKSEEKERAFWSKHDSTDFIDYKKAKRSLFPNLKPSVKSISIRLPESLIEALKVLANKKDIPYQSLAKMMLSQQVERALQTAK